MATGIAVIIAGGRDFTDYPLLCATLDRLYPPATVTTVVCGCARGADLLGARWADEHGISVAPYPPDYVRYPKRTAPFVRNWAMAYAADELVAFHDGVSGGTTHMIAAMNHLGKPVWVRSYPPATTHPKVALNPAPTHLTASTPTLV